MKELKEMDNILEDILTDKELKEMNANYLKVEDEGLKNTLKHFDRLHDKLFTFNNILIGGYFALSKIIASISIYTILIPIINLVLLIFIEYRMMKKSRFEANLTNQKVLDIKKQSTILRNINLYSLTTIFTTSLVTLAFLYYLFKI